MMMSPHARRLFTMQNEALKIEAETETRDDIAQHPDSLTCDHIADRELARRLIALHEERIRYLADEKVWLVRKQGVWNRDRHRNQMMLLAENVADQIHAEVDAELNKDRQKRLRAFAKIASTAAGQRGMIARASREPGILLDASELDSDPWLLCCRNGVLDLRSGQLREHRPDDYCTRRVPVDYDRHAQSDDWDDFLAEVQPNPEVRAFLCRAVGYSLTGCTTEEAFLFLHGPTATGKTTFLGAIRAALGEYAVSSAFDTFLERGRSGQIRNDIARLNGIRFVSALECNRGDRLDAGQLKSMTGGDAMVARFLRQELFEFFPQFKIWLAANDRLHVPADDDAVWRRILEVPFTAQVSESRRSEDLKNRLKDTKFVGPAILKWAVDGCLEWQARKLDPPKAVLAATRAYRSEMADAAGEPTAQAGLKRRLASKDDSGGCPAACERERSRNRSWGFEVSFTLKRRD